MIKLLEPELLIKCRKEDLALIKGLQEEIQSEFTEIMKNETNEDYKCDLTIVESEFLSAE